MYVKTHIRLYINAYQIQRWTFFKSILNNGYLIKHLKKKTPTLICFNPGDIM